MQCKLGWLAGYRGEAKYACYLLSLICFSWCTDIGRLSLVGGARVGCLAGRCVCLYPSHLEFLAGVCGRGVRGRKVAGL